MPDLDRVVAGLRCRDVLDLLADYVDGELDASVERQVNEHLRTCDACEKFGGEYASLVRELRQGLEAPAADPEVRGRLADRMVEAWSDPDE